MRLSAPYSFVKIQNPNPKPGFDLVQTRNPGLEKMSGFGIGFPKSGSLCKTGFSVLGKAKSGFRFRFWKSHNIIASTANLRGRGVEVKDGMCSAGNAEEEEEEEACAAKPDRSNDG